MWCCLRKSTVDESEQRDWRPARVASPGRCNITLSQRVETGIGVERVCAGLQRTTVDEISNVTGGLRLLQALAEAETQAESTHGPPAKVDLDVLWIFVGKASGLSHDEAPASLLRTLNAQTFLS